MSTVSDTDLVRVGVPGWPTLPDGRYAALRTHRADGASHGGFRWPTEVGGVAVAPDWDPDQSIKCGRGLHGLLWGCGDGSLLAPALTWVIVAVDPGDIATRIDGMGIPPKIRFRSAEVIHVGDCDSATGWIAAHGGAGLPVVYGTATAGDGGVLVIRYYDRSGRGRLCVGQVDGVTLLPDTPYRLDAAGEFVEVV